MKDLINSLWQNKWRIIGPIAVLVVGFVATSYLLGTKQGAMRAQRLPAEARLVQVEVVQKQDHRVVIEAYGEVVPRQDVSLKPQVSGEIVAMGDQLIPGGRLEKGDLIVQIDPRDYELAVLRAESALAKAEASLAREKGSQTVAREEYEFLDQDLAEEERALVLRQPQLKTAEADVEAARAALDEARLDLERTRVVAPFDAMVITENVDVGTRVSTGDVITRLVGTESYWVELAVPSNQLRWLDVPANRRRDPAAAADISEGARSVRLFNSSSWGNDLRDGQLIRVLGDLTDEGRMAKVLVEIPDPLATGSDDASVPLVLLGSYLRAEVDGRVLHDVVVLDRALIRDAGYVWVANSQDELEIREVEIEFTDKTNAYISDGLGDGDRVIITDIPTAAPGMPLRVPGADRTETEILGQKGADDGADA